MTPIKTPKVLLIACTLQSMCANDNFGAIDDEVVVRPLNQELMFETERSQR